MRSFAVVAVVALGATGCGTAHRASNSAAPATTMTEATSTTTTSATTTSTTTWRAGCPVGPDQLRRLTIEYWGFDDQAHTGALVVHASVAKAVLQVFDRLRAEHFPIRRMEPIDAFNGSDEASMDADNTSGFNCRYAVADGPPRWSRHAYGKAIDVNPVENPYLQGGKVQPPAGAAFVDRSPYRPGMAVPGGALVNAFASVGWSWGGRWSATPDYQHFETG